MDSMEHYVWAVLAPFCALQYINNGLHLLQNEVSEKYLV